MILLSAEPRDYLPHRPPFLFVDRVVALEAGVAATGELTVTSGGYFPPLLLVEAMAQLGGIAAGQTGSGSGVLAAVRAVRLPPEVRPGARLDVSCRVIRFFGQLVQIEGNVKEKGEVIASAELTLAVEPEKRV